MAKPVAGDIVVLPFPQTNLQAGKRRPALVVADAGRADLLVCQITSQFHSDAFAIPLAKSDFDQGGLPLASLARCNRLATVEQTVVIATSGRVTAAKLTEIKAKIRQLFA